MRLLEYVYGSWEECYEMLVNGEIDVMSGVSYTPDRLEYMSFPDLPIATETYHIFVKHTDMTKYPSIESLRGKKIGVSGGTLTADSLKAWNENNQMGMEIIDYADDDARYDAFDRGETDATADLGMQVSGDSGLVPVVEFGADSTYIAVAKNRPDILMELNAAVSTINSTMPEFASSLLSEYYSDTAVMNNLSSEDAAWFQEHQTIQVGYLENMSPFSQKSKGSASGTFVDVFNYALERMNLYNKVEYHPYTTMDEMLRDLMSGKLDAAGPYYGSAWHAEERQILQSMEVAGVKMNLISRKKIKVTDQTKFAIADTIPGHKEYLEEFYPESENIHYASVKDAIKAVRRGEADAMVMSTYLVSLNLRYDEDLVITPVDSRASLSIAVAHGNHELLSILNRGISAYGDVNIQESLLKHTDSAYQPNLKDYIQKNIKAVSLVVILVMLIITSQIMLMVFRKKHESEVRAKELAESANQAKTAFLFNMSHDIRTPMNAVIGLSHLAKDHIHEPERMETYLSQISVAGDQLLSIINNVLEVSRIESDKMVITEDVEDVQDVMQTIETIFKNQSRANKVSVSVTKSFDHRYLYMDRTHLEEVIINLVSNALKYTPDGGRVDIIAREYPGDNPEITKVRFTVKDTGIGMSEEYQKKMFQEFERERNSTVSGIQGTGLGLAIVKKLVDLMHGTIEVESQKGVGTSITVEMTHRIGKAPEEEETFEISDDMLKGKRALLAEDMDINAMIAQEILTSHGLLVDRVANGREAVDAIKDHEAGYYNLVLMDIQMPVMDGYEATQEIRKLDNKKKAKLPILAMTANAFKEDQIKARQMGMDGHIAKPIDINQLFAALNKVMVLQKVDVQSDELDDFKKYYADQGVECGYFIYQDTPEESIVYVDTNVIAMFGCNTEKEFMNFVGGSFRGMVHPEDLMLVERKIALQQRNSKENIDKIDYRIMTKDGEERIIRDIGYKAKKGNDTLYYVYIADITENSKKEFNL